ncbi:MAG: thiamine-phosphate kinase [bacterium]|nr:thiamine-phosphate kinase [bacterium]
MKTVAELGEFGLIQQIERILSVARPDILVGLGDDAAVIAPSDRPLVVTTDAMVSGVHFKSEWTSAADLAHKALASALSDLACKCARPAYAVATLGLTGDEPVDWVLEFYHRLAVLQGEWGAAIVGGDTVRSPAMWISIGAWGEQLTENPVRISTARPGDWILMTGETGGAAAGLDLLLSGAEPAWDYAPLLDRFHRPVPRIAEALHLAEIAVPSSMTDLSDGLARDLPKLCRASGVGAVVEAEALPRSEALNRFAGDKTLEYAWRGGEDYELLFTLDPDRARRLMESWPDSLAPLTRIGVTAQETAIRINGLENLSVEGFDHFAH